ncbi:MAG: DUF2769 domain-containing protein [Candidatus Bathyarchaeota archaeon]|nr:DUF2769 domain-containing protein [Candidatus Bathyarchaeota archaeon]
MPEKVPDTPENMEICKRFCGPCPTFKPNELMNFRPHALFCARGKSEKPTDQIENKGCNCPTCDVLKNYGLVGGWFCIHGIS